MFYAEITLQTSFSPIKHDASWCADVELSWYMTLQKDEAHKVPLFKLRKKELDKISWEQLEKKTEISAHLQWNVENHR